MSRTEGQRLNDLQGQVDDLLGILKQESEAIAGDDIRQLAGVTDNKRAMLEQLLNFAEDEARSARSDGERWRKLVDSLNECKRLNLINGASMTAMHQSRQDALRVLYGQQPGEKPGYGADGEVDAEPASRRLGKA
ncbi:MAG: hypothetical protein AAGA23_10470 [Pseudomonadota bacterium]